MKRTITIQEIDNGFLVDATNGLGQKRVNACRSFEELAYELWVGLSGERHQIGDQANLVVKRSGVGQCPADELPKRGY
jgi:hypothetical protein